jgi:hypothetical protein
MIRKSIGLLIILLPLFVVAKSNLDTIPAARNTMYSLSKQPIYFAKGGDSFTCKKPATFDFLTHIPADAFGYIGHSFKKDNLYKLGVVAASTGLLLILDQRIANGVQQFANNHGIDGRESLAPLIQVNLFGKSTNLMKWPKNINTAFYNLGQGSSVVYMAAGFLIAGKIKKDPRALQTASQLVESFLALGVGTQLIKYGTGRENPSDATVVGGRWRPFPTMSNFQNNKPLYDAFPSGHLATLVSAITIVSENYPRKRWIKPVGYSIAGLMSLAMVNNGVHWASDFPLGFAIGYGYAKYIAKKNKQVLHRPANL